MSPPSPHRRTLLRLALAASLGRVPATARARPTFDSDPFQLGVASGMPTADGIVLWTRLLAHNPLRNPWSDSTLEVRWEVADDDRFTRIVRAGTAQALPQLAHSVHVEVDGLAPGRVYHYRFIVGDATGPVGRTRTAPATGDPVPRLRLAFASCQRLGSGPFVAYRHLLDEDADAIAFLGDYIYDHGAMPSPTVPRGIAPALTLDGYRAHYELHKRAPELQSAHAALPWLMVWDDHEVVNDYAGGPLRGLASGRVAAQRRAAYQAYYEHMPLRLASLVRGLEGLTRGGEELRIYGRLDWGRLASLHLLDCRQYRDAQACSGLGGLVVAQDCPPLADHPRTMLGAEQEAWLTDALARRRRGVAQPWNLMLQTTMFSPRRIPLGGGERIWNDGWDGYPAARARLADCLEANDVAGPVFLGGDLHENWACNVPAGGRAGGSPIASEFVGTGITMKSFVPGAVNEIRAANPHAVYADAGRCGYGVLELAPRRLDLRFRVIDDLGKADPSIATAASFEVDADRPGVRMT